MLRLSDAEGPTRVLTERPLFFAAEPMRFGILTEPPPAQARRRGVIVVNDGATYHVGANRLNVALARRWACEGYTVLRMDLAGLGESDARAGQRYDEAFPEGAIEDIAAAVRYLRSSCGSTEVTLMGLCSGAYHCLRAAIASLPINRILLVNPQNYFWKRGMTVDDLQLIEIVRAPGKYRQRMLSMRNWGKLLRGEADVRRIAWVQICHAWLRAKVLVRDVARRVHLPLPGDLGRELEQLVARGVQIVFVFARDEAGLELLQMQSGCSLARLGNGCRLHIIDGADHIFSQRGARRRLEEVLSGELLAARADMAPIAMDATVHLESVSYDSAP
jgi:pimeloyl-ACP methyl ester carboxylesterase